MLLSSETVKYGFVPDNKEFYAVKGLCAALKVSRRDYYNWVNRVDSVRTLENKQILTEIKQIFHQHKAVYGAPRIHRELAARGFSCGLNRVARMMNKASILPKTIRKFRITTDSRNSTKPAHNILAQIFQRKAVMKNGFLT